MIVDLERNDLGRVCRYGTVRVGRARWRSRASPRSITWSRPSRGGCGRTSGRSTWSGRSSPAARSPGAPKIRAMEIIDELEPTRGACTPGRSATSAGAARAASTSRSGRCWSKGIASATRSAAGSWPTPTPRPSTRETLHKGRGLRAVLEGGGAATMIWVGGRIVPDDSWRSASPTATFEHGLGLFETLRTWNGHPTLLDRHLARLRRSAEELGIPLDPADLPDAGAVAASVAGERVGGGRPAADHADRGRVGVAGARPSGCDRAPLRRRCDDGGSRPRASAPGWSSATIPWRGTRRLNYWSRRLAFEEAGRQGSTRSCLDAGRPDLGGEPDESLPRPGRDR